MVGQYPQISEDELVEYYNTVYRLSDYAIDIGTTQLDVPIAIPWSGVSFQRFQTFFNLVQELRDQKPAVVPTDNDTIVDLGAYQGLFLYAAKKAWNCRAIAYDYNRAGIEFARKGLNIDEAILAKDIYADTFDAKARYVTLIHAFEHLRYPDQFLRHARKNVLLEGGFLYLELPSVYGTPLSDPTHFYTYSMECLSYLLQRNGFRVLTIREHGEPENKSVNWRNSRMNISVLAQATKDIPDIPAPSVDADKLLRLITGRYRSLVRRMVWAQAMIALRSLVRAIYQVIFVLVIERFSYGLARSLKLTVAGWLRKGGT